MGKYFKQNSGQYPNLGVYSLKADLDLGECLKFLWDIQFEKCDLDIPRCFCLEMFDIWSL
jgi:hypothetical protein